MKFIESLTVCLLSIVSGCAQIESDNACVSSSQCVKYMLRAVNSAELRKAQGTDAKANITPWTLTLESDSNLANMRELPCEVDCKMTLRDADRTSPRELSFTLHKKSSESMTYEGANVGITKYEWEPVSLPLEDDWKLNLYVSGMDYPAPEPIAAMFSFGAYMSENYGASAFSERGVLIVVKRYEKDKILYVDLSRYTVGGRSLDMHSRLFKRFVHGDVKEEIGK